MKKHMVFVWADHNNSKELADLLDEGWEIIRSDCQGVSVATAGDYSLIKQYGNIIYILQADVEYE